MNYKKLRWVQHPESSVLVQLQALNCGVWFTLEGTTTHTLNDAGKYAVMQRKAKELGY